MIKLFVLFHWAEKFCETPSLHPYTIETTPKVMGKTDQYQTSGIKTRPYR